MADELPRDSKVKIREIVQIEIDITALIQEANGITEFQDELNLVTSKVKKMFINLRRKLDVMYKYICKISLTTMCLICFETIFIHPLVLMCMSIN